MAAHKFRLKDFIDYLKKSPLAATLALIPIITMLLVLIYKIIERPGVALVVLCVLGSVLLFAYNIWIIDARKTPRSKKRLYSMKLRISIHVISFCVLLVCWVVVACMVPNRRAGCVLLKLGRYKFAAKRLADHLKSKKDDNIAWLWLALTNEKLKKEHTEIMNDIRKGPTDADAYYWQGRICNADSNMPGAEDAYIECVRNDQSHLRAYPKLIYTLLKIADPDREKNIKLTISYLKRANYYVDQGISFAESARNDGMVQFLGRLKCMILNDLAYAHAEVMNKDMLDKAHGYADQAVKLSAEYDLSPLDCARCKDTLAYVKICREDLKGYPQTPDKKELERAEELLNKALTLLGPRELQNPEEGAVRTRIEEHKVLLATQQKKIKAEDG